MNQQRKTRGHSRIAAGTAAVAAVLSLSLAGAAQQGGQQQQPSGQDTRQLGTSSTRYVAFEDVRGAAIRGGTATDRPSDYGQENQSGGRSGAGAGSTLGVIVDVCVAPPAAGRSDLQAEAKAIVVVSETAEMGDTEKSGDRGPSALSKKVLVPLRELQWHESGQFFTCSKSAEELRSMPEYHSTGMKSPGMKGRDEYGGDQGGDYGTDQEKAGAVGMGKSDHRSLRMDALEASKISIAKIHTEDNEKAPVAGLVFDLQQGSLGYLLASFSGTGMTDQPGERARDTGGMTARSGAARAIPWNLVRVKHGQDMGGIGDDDAREDRDEPGDVDDPDGDEPDGDDLERTGRSGAMGTGMDLVLFVPFRAAQLETAPKLDPSNLAMLQRPGTVEQIRKFYADLSTRAATPPRDQ